MIYNFKKHELVFRWRWHRNRVLTFIYNRGLIYINKVVFYYHVDLKSIKSCSFSSLFLVSLRSERSVLIILLGTRWSSFSGIMSIPSVHENWTILACCFSLRRRIYHGSAQITMIVRIHITSSTMANVNIPSCLCSFGIPERLDFDMLSLS